MDLLVLVVFSCWLSPALGKHYFYEKAVISKKIDDLSPLPSIVIKTKAIDITPMIVGRGR